VAGRAIPFGAACWTGIGRIGAVEQVGVCVMRVGKAVEVRLIPVEVPLLGLRSGYFLIGYGRLMPENVSSTSLAWTVAS
jgi:hypothetical protein